MKVRVSTEQGRILRALQQMGISWLSVSPRWVSLVRYNRNALRGLLKRGLIVCVASMSQRHGTGRNEGYALSPTGLQVCLEEDWEEESP